MEEAGTRSLLDETAAAHVVRATWRKQALGPCWTKQQQCALVCRSRTTTCWRGRCSRWMQISLLILFPHRQPASWPSCCLLSRVSGTGEGASETCCFSSECRVRPPQGVTEALRLCAASRCVALEGSSLRAVTLCILDTPGFAFCQSASRSLGCLYSSSSNSAASA